MQLHVVFMEFVLLLAPIILLVVPFLIRNSYQQNLVKILDSQDYTFVDSNSISGIGSVNNYFFMPIFPMGYHVLKINEFEKYVYVENYGKFKYLNVAFVSTFSSNLDFLIENHSFLNASGIQTGINKFDKNYNISGKNASEIVEKINNSTECQEIFMSFIENDVKLKLGSRDNKLFLIIYSQFMFFPSQLPYHKNAILLLKLLNS